MSSTGEQMKAAALVAAKLFVAGLWVLLVVFLVPASTLVKVLLVALVPVVWLSWTLFKRWRRRRAATSPAQENGAKKGRLTAPVGTYEELTRGTEEVMQWLRGSKLGGDGNPAYALPWYVVAGPKGSGKTSLLLSSGLDFHVLPSQRASEQQLVRPTQFCDWRVADSAVWLDTSGRYATEGPDADEWSALFETVKRHRRARPVDGFLLTVNAAELLGASDHELERQAKVLRARLDEAMARTSSRFPVYLVFTHMDALEGFGEFFGPFEGGEREQVWGFTFPLAQRDAPARFDDEFNHLYGRLVRRRTVQLGATAGPDKQLRVFKLPGRFRRARTLLGAFAAALFRPNPFSENPLLRGVYFTSSRGNGATAARHVTEPFFTRSFFSEVILPDRNIVAAEQAKRRSPNLRRNLLLGGAGALLLFFVAGMVVSYFNNRAFVAEANARGRRLTEVRRVTTKGSGLRVGEELGAVEDVRQVLADLDEYERTSPPLFMRFGLYAGRSLNYASADPNRGSILRHLYFEAIEELFLKRAVASIEEDLRQFATAPAQPAAAPVAEEEDYLGRHYDLLKVYLMLSKPDKVEPTFLAHVLRDYWVKASLVGGDEAAIRQLEYFASQASAEDAPHPEIDEALVDSARERLLAYPVVNRVYKRITSDVSASVNKPVKLMTITGAREGNLLQNTYTVPGAYTLEGYREMTERLKESVAEEFRKDDWVMRADAGAVENIDLKKDELVNLYQRDYKGHWQRFLQETKLQEFKSKEEAVRSLRLLAGSTSPLESLLREVARQTNLSAASSGWWTWFKGLFASKSGAGSTTEVEREFRPLIQFFEGKAEASPMAQYRTGLKKVADSLNSNGKPLAELSNAMQSGNDTIGLTAARKTVDDTLETKGFNSASPAAEAAGRVLRLPLDSLNTLLVGADFEQIEKTWQGMQKKAQGFEQGFPFADGPEVSLPLLAQFLNPQDGELTKFVRGPLKPYFEEDWSVKKEAADKFSPDFVAYVAAAKRLQDALFPDKGKAPNIEYQLTIAPINGGSARVEIDGGAPLSTADKTTVNLTWPGDKSGVRVTYAPDAGEEVAAQSAGEWGLIKFFRASGGGEGKTPPFTLTPGGTPVRLTLQPKSGDPFRRELFTALRAPKRARRE